MTPPVDDATLGARLGSVGSPNSDGSYNSNAARLSSHMAARPTCAPVRATPRDLAYSGIREIQPQSLSVPCLVGIQSRLLG
jgi:hypothetical protein